MSAEQRALAQPILLAVGFLLLVIISATTVWLVDQSADDSRAVAHTLEVQNTFSNLVLSVRRAESGQRGFLFTSEERYLGDYANALPESQKLIAELRDLTQDNPERKQTLDELEKLTSAKFTEMDRTIELIRAGKQEDARALVLNDQGREITAIMRLIVEAAITDENRLLTERTETSQRNNFLLLMTTLIGALLVIAVGATSFILMRRSIQQREKARDELAGMNANLERIVEFRTADLTEANEEIQRFAYIVSHDLRSPLVNIMGFTTELEALRKDIFGQVEQLRRQLAALNAQVDPSATPLEALGKDFDESIGFIKTSISKMDRLINAVLKLSREGRREFHPERIDMNDLLGSIRETVAHRASEQGAEIIVGDLPPLESDRLAIEQIFSNLIDNSLKYSRAGEPTKIEIDHRSTPMNVVYDVRDNGRGINPQDHQRVFELFRRSGVQDRPGEGIGLAHVRALVRRLGGSMALQSELGKGSTFTVTLPRRWQGENRSAA